MRLLTPSTTCEIEVPPHRPILWVATNAGWQGVLYPTALTAAH